MNRDELCHAVREQLQRLPQPHSAHYGVVPLAPPEEGIVLGEVAQRHHRALEALSRVATLARDVGDPYVVSRLLMRREAVSSSCARSRLHGEGSAVCYAAQGRRGDFGEKGS